MQFKKILVPFDGSEHALSALKVARGLAGDEASAEVHVVTVLLATTLASNYDPSARTLARSPLSLSHFNEYENMVSSVLDNAREDLKRDMGDAFEGASCHLVMEAVVSSSPAAGIVDYVDEHECDLVIMGRRGLGALRGVLGSVSYGVLHAVDIPVLTVK
ncbi:universal stress protein [Eggerthella sp. YY7918]|uniref:universal stress protein n=1 Tax=Eggerthella sp. (strain YY7918) TaxID=502558 RepID=UPI0002171395|nr:universal stress protein [Eggerthella sp. YY7918]BAK45354.1 hypothetical protein EGYY_22810 [Eggerthella sp. YY7918]